MKDNAPKIAKEFRLVIEELRKKYAWDEIEQGLVLAMGSAGLKNWLDAHPELAQRVQTVRKGAKELIDFANEISNRLSTDKTKE